MKAAIKAEPAQDPGTKARLLLDIKAVFDQAGVEALSSEALVEKLCEEGEWAEMPPNGARLTKHGLARLLKSHKIAPNARRDKERERQGRAGAWLRAGVVRAGVAAGASRPYTSCRWKYTSCENAVV